MGGKAPRNEEGQKDAAVSPRVGDQSRVSASWRCHQTNCQTRSRTASESVCSTPNAQGSSRDVPTCTPWKAQRRRHRQALEGVNPAHAAASAGTRAPGRGCLTISNVNARPRPPYSHPVRRWRSAACMIRGRRADRVAVIKSPSARLPATRCLRCGDQRCLFEVLPALFSQPYCGRCHDDSPGRSSSIPRSFERAGNVHGLPR